MSSALWLVDEKFDSETSELAKKRRRYSNLWITVRRITMAMADPFGNSKPKILPVQTIFCLFKVKVDNRKVKHHRRPNWPVDLS
ncbi:hypothetical protein T03_1968 [Trichinella britovi]|uniref:Uncharacterized protein n=1 Tax=Trichinella britovi TaxID=45882 RepID=A0A0V1CXS8_TRIBR|nr:hypothetical protein T03_1968 [Trichinella britovi]